MCPVDKIKKIEMGVAYSTYGERRDVYWVLAETHEALRPLGRPRYSWENNIKMDLNEVVCGGIDTI